MTQHSTAVVQHADVCGRGLGRYFSFVRSWRSALASRALPRATCVTRRTFRAIQGGKGAMHVEDVEYEHDGVKMLGRLAYDEAHRGTRPAVLLCHEAPGLDDNVKGRVERLAELGYVAFGLDCHGGGKVLSLDD